MFADAADRKLGLLLALCLFIPSFAEAALCFRSQPGASIEGLSGRATVSVLWNDQGDAMDEIRVDGEKMGVSSEMVCGDAPPIVCHLGQDGGSVRLVFEENRLKVVSGGLQVTTAGDNGSRVPRLSVRRQRWTMVNELTQLSEAECRALFPVRRTIEVFPQNLGGVESVNPVSQPATTGR
jgi:hypothetical protein